MFDDRSRKFKNQYVELKPIRLEDYEPFVGQRFLDELRWFAEPLHRKVWANVNSTFIGGGVAEMLQGIIPLARALGIDCRWFVIEGTGDFFKVTKKFHNLLQGVNQPISLEEIFHAYLDTIDENTKQTQVVGHLVTVHDPQPAAMIMNGNIYGHIMWRCHIDTSNASRRIWRFLLPYINHYDGAVFTAREFIRDNLQIPAYEIHPSIDPLRIKNKQRSRKEALQVVSQLFHEHNIDPDQPMIAAISRYDVHKNQKGIIRSFRILKEQLGKGKLKPTLVIIGNSASDDPEADEMLAFIKEEANGDPDIHLLINVDNNDEVVGSVMALAQCFIHISTKEGFGLVVSEALWQGTPVIGSKVGGIQKQIVSGYNGFLVDPHEYDTIAQRMKQLLEDKPMREMMSKNARSFVAQRYLLPQMIQKELTLMRYYLEVDNKIPKFRLNDLTYREITSALYGRSIWPFSSDDLKRRLETIWAGLESQDL